MIRLKRLAVSNFKQLQEIDLQFPEHARILVQGKNEAGKSTLFEAVFFALFGNALATEAGTRNLDDLIRYGNEKARVELDVQFGNREFKIVRSIVRGKSNVWELEIGRDGEVQEEIRGNTAVNKRLIAEFGFDGDALLNTCFVEQKKLEKLEGLSKSAREESLAKLLNLDSLVQIESDLKLTADDKRAVERLKKRADLAAIQEELPTHETQLAQTEEKLNLIDLRGAVDGLLNERRAVEQLDAQMQALATQRDEAAQRAERVDAIKQAMRDVKSAQDAAENLAQNTREIERAKQDQAEVRRALDEIPNLQARLAEIRRLVRRVARLDQVRAAHDMYVQRVAQIASAENRLSELNTSLTREETALAEIQARVREHEIAQAIENWIAAQTQIGASESGESVEAKQRARDQLARRFNFQVYGLAALLLVFILAGAVMQSLAFVFFALAVLIFILLIVRATMLWRDLSRASEDLGRAEGEARVRASATASQIDQVRQAEERLRQLGAAIPESIERARQQRVVSHQPIDILRAEQESTRERLLNTRAVLGELQRQNALDDSVDVSAERARCERAAHKAGVMLARWQPRSEKIGHALGIGIDSAAAQRAQFQLQAQIEQLQRRANEVTRLAQDLARREQSMQTLAAQSREAYERARALKPNAAEWHAALTSDDYTAFGKELRAEYDALGGETAIKQAREIEGELGRKQGEREMRSRNGEMIFARVQELLGSSPWQTAPALRELAEYQTRLQLLDLGDEQTLRNRQRELVGRVRSLGDRQKELERDLGLVHQMLDRVACQAEWERKMRESMVRERGAEMVSVARRRIVKKILPTTMDYMRRILPTLTRDRYHDAQLDPDSYKIQAWDERAGMFKEKNIFSGGTKDQFSLALRLAFALATLPQERGSAPSFIFLDEPLGSFDDERASALIDLLTAGEIARAFDQVFLISHVHVNERLFTHRLVLENGRVAETNLPAVEASAQK